MIDPNRELATINLEKRDWCGEAEAKQEEHRGLVRTNADDVHE